MAYYICSSCDYGAASWIGKCPGCGEWNTFIQKKEESQIARKKATPTQFSQLKKIDKTKSNRQSMGMFEFDRVLGGGITPGEVVLLSGEPGIGKSTLLLQIIKNGTAIYVSGEESLDQVQHRAERLHAKIGHILFSDESNIDRILSGIETQKEAQLVILDSIQTLYTDDVETPPGSINQIKEVANRVISFAKKSAIPFLVIGHVTKDGDLAGPKTLEHMVDCVLSLEGDASSPFRILRSSKNRFGSIDEIGVFEMKESGLHEVNSATALLAESTKKEVGKAIVGICEGNRPIFLEVQALAVPTVLSIPRRVAKGIDFNRIQLLIAIAKKYLGLKLDSYDIYFNVVGGLRITSPLADVGIIAALYSSVLSKTVNTNHVFIGEVGLLGEIRSGYLGKKTSSEAKRLDLHPLDQTQLPSIKEIQKFIVS
ncbi:MAG: DNA repair protein RadA [bacterium]